MNLSCALSSIPGYHLTDHAHQRMQLRGISRNKLETVLYYGRCIHTRGASIYVIGHKEVEMNAQKGIDIQDCEGVQVVCTSQYTVLTVYRNRNFRNLRPRYKHPKRKHLHKQYTIH
ncbi:DUF4258 domain-containing protein [Candidatus Venteria ishoeyi]|uniref:DUF4258 domain-containing protein n=1 Tax=Candidatus Venteria ishoeyi TaxID=1899563 RepID=A0A1H6F8N9_9GAMM|nr:DUF4258 domain-containing protein [Candidatus Venteria ishoeyi]MDM8548223.1 DUF4258 domain-containing protein [Candidatus Venteria ishoeyi]SEH06482.1 Uncharacterised protein [Candidatus Venteria ishoeyi]